MALDSASRELTLYDMALDESSQLGMTFDKFNSDFTVVFALARFPIICTFDANCAWL